jgi:hypothetical protein
MNVFRQDAHANVAHSRRALAILFVVLLAVAGALLAP